MNIQLHSGDCLEVMKQIPDGSVDMILADLPYGTTACKWDSVIPFAPLWEQYERIIKPNGAIVLTASQPFTSALVMSKPAAFKHSWIWHKNKASGHLSVKRRPLVAHEDVLVFSFGSPFYTPQMTSGHSPGNHAVRRTHSQVYNAQRETSYGGQTVRFPRSVLNIPVVNNDGSGDERVHPTQKPVPLMEYLIRTYTNEGETVLDNTMGSGTTGIACENTNRSFIGIELDAGYFKLAKDRITKARVEQPQASQDAQGTIL
jgi:site-specific DNA-methyltransferase (adenine-specific)